MQKFVIIPNITKERSVEVTEKIIKLLISFGATCYIDEKLSSFFENAVGYTEIPKDADIIIVVGGDGSVIDASVKAVAYDLPIIGVNLGKLGYLSEVEPDKLINLKRLLCGDYRTEERMLLCVKKGEEISGFFDRHAINDIIISHESFLGIGDITLETKKGESFTYRADGLILSTPIGSTAYSLSAGGPIISHDVDSILLTPICPHSFFNRSIVFSPKEILKITNKGADKLNISVDGRLVSDLKPGEFCQVSVSSKRLKMITFSDNIMISTLFEKMNKTEHI